MWRSTVSDRCVSEVVLTDTRDGNGALRRRHDCAHHACADQQRVTLQFSQPGKPVQNAFIESFNGKFRDECLNEPWLLTRQEAQVVIEAWRREYNQERTHSTIGDATPMEFIQHHQGRAQAAQELTSLVLV